MAYKHDVSFIKEQLSRYALNFDLNKLSEEVKGKAEITDIHTISW